MFNLTFKKYENYQITNEFFEKIVCKLEEQNYIKINNDEFKTPIFNERTMETNVGGVFIAGVICGGLKTNKWFIENSRDHSEKIISSILKNNS